MGKPQDPSDDKTVPGDGGRDSTDALIGAVTRRALTQKLGALPPASDLDDELLVRYLDAALPSGERAALERRLLVDDDARERLAILVGALGDAGITRSPLTSPLSRVLHGVTRHVFHVAGGVMELLRGHDGASALQPAMAVRGAAATQDSTRPSAFKIEREFHTAQGPLSARFELHAERADASGPAAQALVDLVVHVGDTGHSTGVRCKLLRDGRPIDSREVEHNTCTFTRLVAARYDIELRKGGVEIGRVLFDLRG